MEQIMDDSIRVRIDKPAKEKFIAWCQAAGVSWTDKVREFINALPDGRVTIENEKLKELYNEKRTK